MSNEKLPELSENEGGALSLLLKVIDNAGNPTELMYWRFIYSLIAAVVLGFGGMELLYMGSWLFGVSFVCIAGFLLYTMGWYDSTINIAAALRKTGGLPHPHQAQDIKPTNNTMPMRDPTFRRGK